ncbi:unnamed protein product [Rhizoctonia solani]|uniref:Uncharacterized protein n=1 Tax=Rhizoctonia solani TaxID=456999 RepID=A0A8H2W883_9AGAM|nr:unnamed protein product [Rhizoctonia solani]
MGQSRTRDIGFCGASNAEQGSSQAPTGTHDGFIAKGLWLIPGVCNGSVRFIEEHLPDELKSFDDLLGPLIRCNDEIVAKIKHWTHTSPIPTSGDSYGAQLGAQSASPAARKSFISSSSGHSGLLTRGLVMDARELCKMWAGCATNRFRLASFQWFRDTVGARHEYLLFKLESDKSSAPSRKDLWLRLERRPSTKARGSKRKLMGSLLGQFTADDLITLSPRREDLFYPEDAPLEPQASVVFSEKLSLRYLVDVLDIIHGESLEYHIAGANCWFYASTIAEIVTKKARAVWEHGDISYCDHWKSKYMVNPEQYSRIMNRVRHLREN